MDAFHFHSSFGLHHILGWFVERVSYWALKINWAKNDVCVEWEIDYFRSQFMAFAYTHPAPVTNVSANVLINMIQSGNTYVQDDRRQTPDHTITIIVFKSSSWTTCFTYASLQAHNPSSSSHNIFTQCWHRRIHNWIYSMCIYAWLDCAQFNLLSYVFEERKSVSVCFSYVSECRAYCHIRHCATNSPSFGDILKLQRIHWGFCLCIQSVRVDENLSEIDNGPTSMG